MNKCRLEGYNKKARRTFCSSSCSSRYHNQLWNSRNQYGSYGKKVTRIPCIGIICRGEKMFSSQGKYDRVCCYCQKIQNGYDNGYTFNGARRGTKAG